MPLEITVVPAVRASAPTELPAEATIDFEDEPTAATARDCSDVEAEDDSIAPLHRPCRVMHSIADRIAGAAQFLELSALQNGVDRLAEGPPPQRRINDGL